MLRVRIPTTTSTPKGDISIELRMGTFLIGLDKVMKYDLTAGTIASTILNLTLPSDANQFIPDTSLECGRVPGSLRPFRIPAALPV